MNSGAFFQGDGDDIGQLMNLAKLPERPNHRMEVRILLQRELSLPEMFNLQLGLQQNNMQVDIGPEERNIIVTGTPPDNEYNAQSVLAEVTRFDNGATILP